eukprot:280369-Hanusia_phi.AAC.1
MAAQRVSESRVRVSWMVERMFGNTCSTGQCLQDALELQEEHLPVNSIVNAADAQTYLCWAVQSCPEAQLRSARNYCFLPTNILSRRKRKFSKESNMLFFLEVKCNFVEPSRQKRTARREKRAGRQGDEAVMKEGRGDEGRGERREED